MVEMHTSATSFDQRHQMPSASEELDSTKTFVFAARLLFCVAGDASMCQLWRGRSWVVGGPTQYQPTLIPTPWQRVPTIHQRLREVGISFKHCVLGDIAPLFLDSSLLRVETPSFFEIRGCSKALRLSEASLTSDSTSATSTVLSRKLFEVPSDKVLLQDLHSIHNQIPWTLPFCHNFQFFSHRYQDNDGKPQSTNDLHVRRLWSLIYKQFTHTRRCRSFGTHCSSRHEPGHNKLPTSPVSLRKLPSWWKSATRQRSSAHSGPAYQVAMTCWLRNHILQSWVLQMLSRNHRNTTTPK